MGTPQFEAQATQVPPLRNLRCALNKINAAYALLRCELQKLVAFCQRKLLKLEKAMIALVKNWFH